MLDARTYRELARAYFKLANMARGLAITTERNAELELKNKRLSERVAEFEARACAQTARNHAATAAT